MARWDTGLGADQRAFVIGYGRLGFRPSLASEAAALIVECDFREGRRTGNPERHALEMSAEWLADHVVCKAIKAYRKHLAELDAEPLTQVEARGILADVARTGEAAERIRAVSELARIEGWAKDAGAKLRLVAAQAALAEAQSAPPASTAEALVIPPMVSPEKWGVQDA